jgi:Zn-dependent peptidase ImmA (M78 family)
MKAWTLQANIRNGFDEGMMVEELKSFFGEVKTLDEMVQRAEEKGVFVLRSGYIKNVRRTLDPQEFKGFVLFDDIAPVVFINNRDNTRGKAFTLVHAIVHVLAWEKVRSLIGKAKTKPALKQPPSS